MKITELDLKAEGKRYKCGNSIFKVKGGNLIDVERNTYLGVENISIADLLEMDFEEIKETKNPYERVNLGKRYYFKNEIGEVDYLKDLNGYFDDEQFIHANYFNNKNYAEYVAFKETLMRKLDKFAWEHNAKVVNWDDWSNKHFITFNSSLLTLNVSCCMVCRANNIYFTSKEIAEMALEKFKDDLMKLYTWEFDF